MLFCYCSVLIRFDPGEAPAKNKYSNPYYYKASNTFGIKRIKLEGTTEVLQARAVAGRCFVACARPYSHQVGGAAARCTPVRRHERLLPFECT